MMFIFSQGNWPKESKGSTINEMMREGRKKGLQKEGLYNKQEQIINNNKQQVPELNQASLVQLTVLNYQ